MNSKPPVIALSPLDEARFGIRVAKSVQITLDIIPEVISYCRENQIDLLIARCLVDDLPTAQAMERRGFLLMDTLVYYRCNLLVTDFRSSTSSALIRPIYQDEAELVKMVAADAFRGYLGHYYADSRLNRIKVEEVYQDWAYRSCLDKEIAETVLVAQINGELAGFLTLRINNVQEGEGLLFGVAKWAQGQAIGRSLMIGGMEWCRARGASTMLISTQILNYVAQKLWIKLGFQPYLAYYTFHKWFFDNL